MNRFAMFVFTAALVGAAAQAADTSRAYPVGAFDSVAASGPHHVVVTVGGARSVRATGDAAVLDKMEVVVLRDGLQIRPRKQYRRNFSWKSLPPATFYVTLPRLAGASLAGSGDMAIDRVHGEKFSVSLAGSGDMRIASLEATRASINVAGSGELAVRGRTDEADISIAGSGRLRGRDLAVDRAAVSVAGSGDAQLTARETAQVSIVGSGRVDVAGTARCAVSRIGSGKARCGA